jgi:hypothetical protein
MATTTILKIFMLGLIVPVHGQYWKSMEPAYHGLDFKAITIP